MSYDAINSEPQKNTRADNSQECVGVHATAYLQGLTLRNYSPRTIQIYAWAIRDFEAFLRTRGVGGLHQVQPVHVELYRLSLFERSFQPASVDVYLRAIRQLFAYLTANHVCFLNPAEGLVIPQAPRKLLPVPSEEEVQRLLDQPNVNTPVGLRDRAILETAYGTGARLKELVGLTVERVLLTDQTVRLMGKGSKERLIPLGRQAAEWLGRYLAGARPKLPGAGGSDRLWISQRGGPLGYGGVIAMVRIHAKASGMAYPISPHALRRACVTHMLRRGASPAELQEMHGHASLGTLSQYLQVAICDIKDMHARTRPGA